MGYRSARKAKRHGKRGNICVAEPPVAFVMGAVAAGVFVGALLAPEGESGTGVLSALLDAVSLVLG